MCPWLIKPFKTKRRKNEGWLQSETRYDEDDPGLRRKFLLHKPVFSKWKSPIKSWLYLENYRQARSNCFENTEVYFDNGTEKRYVGRGLGRGLDCDVENVRRLEYQREAETFVETRFFIILDDVRLWKVLSYCLNAMLYSKLHGDKEDWYGA